MRLIPVFTAAFLLLFYGGSVSGQGTFVDSLTTRLNETVGAPRVDILNQLTYEFISRDNDKVLLYSNEALQLANQLKYQKGQGIAHTYRGVYEYLSGQFPEAH